MNLYQDVVDSPCGPVSLVCDTQGRLLHLDFPDQGERQQRLLQKRFGTSQCMERVFPTLQAALNAYFAGEYQVLDDLECDLGGTQFQRRVWDALKTIPAGETRSYKQLAQQIGKPKAVRAVARANALNPLSLVYPCHRVIGSDGQLTGYAGGLHRKAWLLQHEGAILSAL